MAHFTLAERAGQPAEPSQEGLDWLRSTASDEKVACGAFGHRFPKPVPGRKLPRGVQVVAWPQAGRQVVQIIGTCPDCGEDRDLVTGEGGVIDEFAVYGYDPPRIPGTRTPKPGWHPPRGANLRRRHYKAEAGRRLHEQFFGAIVDERAQAEDAAG
jgi:hypothetical protein